MKECNLYLHIAEEQIPFSRCTKRECMTVPLLGCRLVASRGYPRYHSIEPIPVADNMLEEILFTSISAGYIYEPQFEVRGKIVSMSDLPVLGPNCEKRH